jgi:hypothetical protein
LLSIPRYTGIGSEHGPAAILRGKTLPIFSIVKELLDYDFLVIITAVIACNEGFRGIVPSLLNSRSLSSMEEFPLVEVVER